MTSLKREGVPFRARRSMVASAVEGRLYFYGGVGVGGSESILDVGDDLWCYDPARRTWDLIEPSGDCPAPRRCPGFQAADHGIVLFGGSGLTGDDGMLTHTFRSDLWEFRPASRTWRCLEEGDEWPPRLAADDPRRTAPGPRYAAVWKRVGGLLVLFGGYTEDGLGRRMLRDAWLYDRERWVRVPEPVSPADADRAWPAARYGAMAASDGRWLYVFGGAGPNRDFGDLWRLDPVRGDWERCDGAGEVSGIRPAPRYCGVLGAHGGRLFLFGGRSRWRPRVNFNDLWVFDESRRRWTQLMPNREPHRYDAGAQFPGYHAKAAHASLGDFLYVLGGEGRRGHVSDFWRLHYPSASFELLQAARVDDPILW